MSQHPKLIYIKPPLLSPLLDAMPVLELVMPLVDSEEYAGSLLVSLSV